MYLKSSSEMYDINLKLFSDRKELPYLGEDCLYKPWQVKARISQIFQMVTLSLKKDDSAGLQVRYKNFPATQATRF